MVSASVKLCAIPAASAAFLMIAGSASAGGYDGTYRGTTTLARGAESTCGKTEYPMAVNVVNGQFAIVWDPRRHVGVNLTIQQDGSFSGSQQYTVGNQTGELKASGRVAGNVLDAKIDGQYCARSYRLTRS